MIEKLLPLAELGATMHPQEVIARRLISEAKLYCENAGKIRGFTRFDLVPEEMLRKREKPSEKGDISDGTSAFLEWIGSSPNET